MTSPDADSGSIPRVTPNASRWLDGNWPFVGAVVVLFLVCLLPLLVPAWPVSLVVTYVLLLAYLIHQLEEHLGDRFRRFLNTHIGRGREALTPHVTMWINVGEVWVLYLAVLLMAGLVDPGFGLIAAYTTLLNAVTHVLAAVALRRCNPGLWTALGLFLPLGTWALIELTRTSGLGPAGHVVGIIVAVVVHAAIVLLVRRRVLAAAG